MNNISLSFLLFVLNIIVLGQGRMSGKILENGKPVEFVSVGIIELGISTTSNSEGQFTLENVPFGEHTLDFRHISYNNKSITTSITARNSHRVMQVYLEPKSTILGDFVVTGTRTEKRKTESPVIVNVINSKTLNNVQACNLSEGLKFQPGLRVETDCQTCNYTQLRINGLAGGYSQILINGRPIFSPLTSLYGLEQIPVNMIDRIEVIRGGGSSLYGSSAIGGTVNVITKIPKKNNYELNIQSQSINGKAFDNIASGNVTLLTKKKNIGTSIFFNKRKRETYDHNNDNYSELPELDNTSIGINSFILFGKNQKIELSLSKLYEYRYGGEMVNKPAYLALQSEERTHNVWMGSADYQINFNKNKSSFITYAGWQQTNRDHYTGIFPDDSLEIINHLNNSPYGTSTTSTIQGGFQINHKLSKTIGLENVLTFGVEYLYDDVFDEIKSYNYLIDQSTQNLGMIAQSDWKLSSNLNLLLGVRMDKHNMLNKPIFSPRGSLLYTFKKNTQLRVSYGSGFKAPQAFDTDLHIAFAGGGISRVSLSPTLIPERSHSFSSSINYDKIKTKYIAGFTLEAFYTRLNNAFYLDPIGEDSFGEVFEKKNGQGATVQGITLELRANYNTKAQLETGLTIQKSLFDNKISYIDEIDGIKEFIRTPNIYGYGILTLFPDSKLNGVINYVYTGSMKVPHFAGATNQLINEIVTTKAFNEFSFKLNYNIPTKKIKSKLNIYLGIKNITNSYQSHFDIGKNRDSNFVYGPSQPRTFYLGLKLLSL